MKTIIQSFFIVLISIYFGNGHCFAQDKVIDAATFLKEYEKIKQSDYLKLIKYINDGDIESVREITEKQSFINTGTKVSYEIGDIDLLKSTLIKQTWPLTKTLKLKNKVTLLSFYEKFISIKLLGNTATIEVCNFDGSNATAYFLGDLYDIKSPLTYAYKEGSHEIFKFLLKKGYKISPETSIKNKHILAHIIENETIDFFQNVYAKTLEPKTILIDNHNLLHYSVLKNKEEHFSFLLQQGFKLSTPTSEGLFPIHLAARYSNDILIAILASNPEQINITDLEGQYPIHYAALSKNRENIITLKSKGADLNSIDNSGVTPLLKASEFNYIGAAELVYNGADYMLTDHNNKNNIFYALDGNNCSALRYYLKNKYYNRNTTSFKDIRKYAKDNNYYKCKSVTQLTKTFHTEFKFQLNLSKIDYSGASRLVSGGFGIEFSKRINPYVDLSYGLNRLYVESGIRDTEELLSIQQDRDGGSVYETNYIDNNFTLKLYPIHYLTAKSPYARIGLSMRKVKEAGFLGSSSIITSDLMSIANKKYTGIKMGLGYQFRYPVIFSMELDYTYGLTDVNTLFPGSYNTFAFSLGLGF